MKRVAKYLVNILFGLLLVFVIITMLLSVVFSDSVAIVRSGSMSPAMPVGALAVAVPIAPEDVKVGDIITFKPPPDPTIKNPDVTVSHRVVEVQNEEGLYFVTKGDANEEPDPFLLPAANVLGKVIFNIPRLGYVMNSIMRYIRSWLGFILLVCIPLVVLVGSTIRDVNRSHNVRLKRLARRVERQRRWKRRRVFGLA
jgi:signal peptidase